MGNPFYVEPASPLEGIKTFVEHVREKSKEAEKQKIRTQASGLVKSGNTDELYKMTIEHPWLSKEVSESTKSHNETLKADALLTAQRVLMGENPATVGIEHAEKVIQAGGDASSHIKQIEQDQQNPEAAKKRAEIFLMFNAPDVYKAMKKGQEKETQKQQIVDGHLVTIGPTGATATKIPGLTGLGGGASSDYERWKQNPAEFAKFKEAGRGSEGDGDKPPSGYRRLPSGDLAFIKGGPADPAIKPAKEQPTKALPAGQVESLVDMHNVSKALKEANDIATEKNVDTGQVAGRLQSIGAKFGVAGDSFVDMDQRLNTASNIMLKLRSGAAVTESEYKRFLREFPQNTDTKKNRERKTKNTINYMNELLSEKVEAFSESGYKTPKIKPVEVPADAPAIGTIKGGYKFNGGNPADPASWTKVQ